MSQRIDTVLALIDNALDDYDLSEQKRKQEARRSIVARRMRHKYR